MRKLRIVLLTLLLLVGALFLFLRLRYGGGTLAEHLPATPPIFNETVLETVADLPLPPGNIAVSPDGRIFFTFHPEGKPEVNVAELVSGTAVPYPPSAEDRARTKSVLSMRLDRQGRLWLLDFASHGMGQPRIVAYDIKDNRLVHEFDFSREVAPRGSMLNDFQVSPDGRWIYIADASIFGLAPALVVYDTEQKKARRLLEKHSSVLADHDHIPRVRDRDLLVLGVFAIRPGVDSIALERNGRYLYFAAVNAPNMYRIDSKFLRDESYNADQIAGAVETVGRKTDSDGITTDDRGNVYITDASSDSIHRMSPDGKIETLVKSDKLRWPDGFSFGPDGYLYVTCSSLQEVIFRSASHVKAHSPYQIFRFTPGVAATPGH
ncbi:MAG: hypothetical protein JNM27_09195 [Leptospirales bacterium]|nr:hypothetical protein [Leptospirales bacterium]